MQNSGLVDVAAACREDAPLQQVLEDLERWMEKRGNVKEDLLHRVQGSGRVRLEPGPMEFCSH